MKNYFPILIFILLSVGVNAQDSCWMKFSNWMNNNKISIRKTFDGSKSENKPACFSFQENHRSENDFFNLDIGVKLFELELLKDKTSSLIFYPKVEWHKSADTAGLKNKLDGGINFEFLPFLLKSPKIGGLPNKGLIVAPWIQGTSSFKRNFIDKVYETRLTGQVSFASNYKFMPGCTFRDKKYNYRGIYYPYFGIEYNKIPDLITKGETEEFSLFFSRLFIDFWFLHKTIEMNIEGVYRQNIDMSSQLRKHLPFYTSSLYYYPGKQEAFSVGFEYKQGYDSDSKYQLVQISSLKVNFKF